MKDDDARERQGPQYQTHLNPSPFSLLKQSLPQEINNYPIVILNAQKEEVLKM